MNNSPLRYPGGKSNITPLLKLIIENTNNPPTTYIEPFAGGAGVAINLLLDGVVDNVVINDYDKAIYSFWRALKEETNALVSLIESTPITIEEWHKQKTIYTTMNKRYSLSLGFAAFFLNRTNRSGILKAGPIGGYAQNGTYHIGARYNREILIERVLRIAKKKSHIFVYNKEIRKFITQVTPKYQYNSFIYFDPPYFDKAKRLYKNFFAKSDHEQISHFIKERITCDWVLTYDDRNEIRAVYATYPAYNYQLAYSAANKGKGTELLFCKHDGMITDAIKDDKTIRRLAISSIQECKQNV
jgi:DNA adenine methylase